MMQMKKINAGTDDKPGYFLNGPNELHMYMYQLIF